jgi:lipopolysaccharide assembly protein A
MSDSTQAPVQKRSRREIARTGAFVALTVLMTLFAVLNVKDVEVNWIFGKSSTPLIIVIVVSLLVGILLTHFAEMRYRRKQR